ncbi:MAG: PQQ-binding-like beta-propeller repeat protein [Pseudomonadota bacterium]
MNILIRLPALTSLLAAALVTSVAVHAADAESRNGATLFAANCASCHAPVENARAPSLQALRGLAPEAVLTSLQRGKMAVQGEALTAGDKREVAQFVTGRTLATTTPPAFNPTAVECGQDTPLAASFGLPSWNGWGNGLSNTRAQLAEDAGMDASQLQSLQFAWAFGFPNALAARTQPSVVGNWLFTGGDNGEVYALDTRSGCMRWVFTAQAAIRTAMTAVPYSAADGSSHYALYFGDSQANAYALDAATGTLLWTRELDTHSNATITAAPAVFDGKVYVATSAAGEEVRGSNPDYACCSFRGSVSALDMLSGNVVWKTYSIASEPTPRGNSANGVQLMGPAGAGIWGSPTIDAARGVLYVGTGNGFAGPPQPTTNAILALDLNSGAIRWTQQTVPNDIWLWQCESAANSGNPNCPTPQGPDFDFGSAPLLTKTSDDRAMLVVPQKSGVLYALDPDANGAVLWQYRIGEGSALGGQWGAATDGSTVYVGVSDTRGETPGGMHAVDLITGQRRWYAPPSPRLCDTAETNCFASQGGAVTLIPGAVLSGGSDGGLRAYSTTDGALLWQVDTNGEFPTVNGVPAKGATMDAAGPVVAGGMLFVNSGYNGIVGRAGNILLAFRLPRTAE